LSKESVKLAAGRVDRALLLFRAVVHRRASIFVDCIAEKPIRSYLSE